MNNSQYPIPPPAPRRQKCGIVGDLASCQCVSGLVTWTGVICWLMIEFVVCSVLALRRFFFRLLRFPPLLKTNTSNSIGKARAVVRALRCYVGKQVTVAIPSALPSPFMLIPFTTPSFHGLLPQADFRYQKSISSRFLLCKAYGITLSPDWTVYKYRTDGDVQWSDISEQGAWDIVLTKQRAKCHGVEILILPRSIE